MNRILAISLLLNLLLVVAIVAGASFTGFFVKSNVLDPLYERQVSVFDTFPLQQGDVVFVGDTLVAGAPVGEMFPRSVVRNRGIIGDTSEGVLGRIDQILAPGPGAIVLMIGTFDVLAGVPRRATVERVGEILGHIENAGDVPVLLLSVLPRDLEALPSVDRLNADYAELAAEHGVDFLDLAALLREEDGTLAGRFTNDGLHLNGPGYEVWRDAIAPWISARSGTAAVVAP